MSVLTWHTRVLDFEVVLELDVTRSSVIEGRLDDVELARLSAGTSSVEDVEYIDRTPDEPEVRVDAAADSHASVDGPSEHQHLVATTLSLEARVVAQLAHRGDVGQSIVGRERVRQRRPRSSSAPTCTTSSTTRQ